MAPAGEWILYPGMITGGYLFAAVSCCCCSSSHPILFLSFFFGFVSSCWPLVSEFSNDDAAPSSYRTCVLFFFLIDSLKNWRIVKFGTVFRRFSFFHFLFCIA